MRGDKPGHRGEPKATLRISIADMMALRVRLNDPGNPAPKFLYQFLPSDGVCLIATIPAGTSAVSIPQQSGRYPISKSLPDKIDDGFVIVYARQPSGRYDAAEVLSRSEAFDFARFYNHACRWVEAKMGGLKLAQDRYAYFAPTRDQWGVVLRDGGFIVIDPSVISLETGPETVQRRKDASTSGIIARVPLQTGLLTKLYATTFGRVEVTTDEQPDASTSWVPFVEWQRLRAIRSRPPELIVPHFREWLQKLKSESGFESWNFRKGMFFGDHLEWWGDRNRRRSLHEGIDFSEGFLPGGTLQSLPEGTPARSIGAGDLVAILDDFLNKTLAVRHPYIRDVNGDVFHTFFSHIQPETAVCGPVAKGQLLGRVAKSSSSGAPAHLHLTGAWVPESIDGSQITMDMISAAFEPIVLTNFNSLLGQ